MASFDMIKAVGDAYVKTWEERAYLSRMILIPLLLKFACYAVAVLYVGTEDIIRLSIVMLPAYFLEGWFLSHWVRTIMLGHRWPFQSSGDDNKDMAQLQERGHGILSGTIAFVLINFLIAGYFAFFTSYIPADMNPENADPKVAVIGLIMMVSTVLLFRYIWLYIPLSVNISWKYYVQKFNPIVLTFWLIALWLVCFVPTMMVLQMGSSLLANLAGGGEASSIAQGLSVLLRVITDSVKNIICTAGVTYAMMEVFKLKVSK